MTESSPPTPPPPPPLPGPLAFHVMNKPVGPVCNLACNYCFYLEKDHLYADDEAWRMDDAVLERFIVDYIAAQEVPEIEFAWQGGEPTLLGVDFFRRVVELQERHTPPGKRVRNAFQTNGVLLDDEWGRFLHEHEFLVGLSIDGPRELTERHRVDRHGVGAFDRIMAGAEVLRRHRVEFNILCCVNRWNARQPLKTYDFLKRLGSPFIQFIPIVERSGREEPDLDLARPPQIRASGPPVTPWSVDPQDYGDFLIAIFDRWIRQDVGRVFVQMFDVQLGVRMGQPAVLCVYAQTCGRGLALEHNGDIYACDHYVYPEYRRGNIMQQSLREMVLSPEQTAFTRAKSESLPGCCRACTYLVQCWGECPKNRILHTASGEPGLQYLCAGLKRFFAHANPMLDRMAGLLRAGRPAAQIMQQLGQGPAAAAGGKIGPNAACPCGSGRKYKKCCGAPGRQS
ncbi:MAG: anaerobic sulfatase maturase [Guyparkeria sp.]